MDHILSAIPAGEILKIRAYSEATIERSETAMRLIADAHHAHSPVPSVTGIGRGLPLGLVAAKEPLNRRADFATVGLRA